MLKLLLNYFSFTVTAFFPSHAFNVP